MPPPPSWPPRRLLRPWPDLLPVLLASESLEHRTARSDGLPYPCLPCHRRHFSETQAQALAVSPRGTPSAMGQRSALLRARESGTSPLRPKACRVRGGRHRPCANAVSGIGKRHACAVPPIRQAFRQTTVITVEQGCGVGVKRMNLKKASDRHQWVPSSFG